jgi:tetratricopeptide (TPR) repeat protein
MYKLIYIYIYIYIHINMITGTTSYYRYKSGGRIQNNLNSSMDIISTELLHTRHLNLFSIEEIFQAHAVIGNMPIKMVDRLKAGLNTGPDNPDKAYLYFWLGLYEHQLGNIEAAISMFTHARMVKKSNLKWQANWYLGVSLCRIDNKQAREILSEMADKYPELISHRKSSHMIDNCRDFGIS